MARQENETRALPSLFDRLIDHEPERTRDPIPSREASVTSFKASVIRDLEALLNTRNHFAELSGEFKHARRSVIAYGLMDFSVLNISNPSHRQRLENALRESISNFEPRLGNVRVHLFPTKRTDRSIRFQVDANIRVEPRPLPVTFEMVMELDMQECRLAASP